MDEGPICGLMTKSLKKPGKRFTRNGYEELEWEKQLFYEGYILHDLVFCCILYPGVADFDRVDSLIGVHSLNALVVIWSSTLFQRISRPS